MKHYLGVRIGLKDVPLSLKLPPYASRVADGPVVGYGTGMPAMFTSMGCALRMLSPPEGFRNLT
jgi:hypothetical protein